MRLNLTNPFEWTEAKSGQVIHIEGDDRRVEILVNGTGKSEVWVSDDPKMKNAVLLGAGEGYLELRYATRRPTFVVVSCGESDRSFYKTLARTQVVERDPSQESFTNVEPRGRPSELSRLMAAVKHNENVRKTQHEQALNDLRAEMENLSRNQPVSQPTTGEVTEPPAEPPADPPPAE
jgi:hypothetical protein